MDANWVAEQRRLMGFEQTSARRKTAAAFLPEGVSPDMHPHEAAHAAGAEKQNSHDQKFGEYFQASGHAHHVGHQAHEVSAMIKSGEVGSDPGHHENAYHLHNHAMGLHQAAAKKASEAGAPWMIGYHQGHVQKHDKAMAMHNKKR
jgi:hypothetical protein